MNYFLIAGYLLFALTFFRIYLLHLKVKAQFTLIQMIFKMKKGKSVTVYFSDSYKKQAKKFFPSNTAFTKVGLTLAKIPELPIRQAREQFLSGFILIKNEGREEIEMIHPLGVKEIVKGDSYRVMKNLLNSLKWRKK